MTLKQPEFLPLDPLNFDTKAEAESIKKQTEAARCNTDSDSSTTSNDSAEEEEFDWDHEEETTAVQPEATIQATRGRAVWLAFMKLSRPFRVFLVAFLGVAICITPLIVVNVRYSQSSAKLQTHVWSLWMTINWATSCGTYLLVDAIPHLVIAVTSLFSGGQAERLKIQLEVTYLLMFNRRESLNGTFSSSWRSNFG